MTAPSTLAVHKAPALTVARSVPTRDPMEPRPVLHDAADDDRGMPGAADVEPSGSRSADIDLARATRAVAELLAALGRDPAGEHLAQTPRRVAHAFAEMLTPRPFTLTTFPNDESYDALVLVRDVPFHSLCEHHLLPFHGVAHIAYLPGARIVGLSKLARVLEHFSRELQVQERLTQQVANLLQRSLAPRGVGVVLEAEHLCMALRGVGVAGARTVTSALLGDLRDDARSRAEFLALVNPGANRPRGHSGI